MQRCLLGKSPTISVLLQVTLWQVQGPFHDEAGSFGQTRVEKRTRRARMQHLISGRDMRRRRTRLEVTGVRQHPHCVRGTLR